ncbi:MAG: DeoR family transcriptional regulator [Salinivirgaceae bacterium]|nr:DeoR family transcriptional regulator [Salinivirgaceae bacterium]
MKIREGFESAGLPMPKIEVSEGGVLVTFQRNNVNSNENVRENDGANVLENVNNKILQLSERQQNIIKRLNKTAEMNVLENVLENSVETSVSLAKHFGVNERTIRRDLQFLQAKGIIRRVGPDKGGHWEIVGQ